MKIFIGLSGGVDSAVAAHKLIADGHDVTGVFIRVWQPDFIPCNQDDEERAAKRVAAHLGIPFQRLDLIDEYKQNVVDTMVAEYKAGRTPNPDVLCNAFVKFGGFLQYALEQGADKVATGHHARVEEHEGRFTLKRGVDAGKDQAYFLWKLTQDELAKTLMPIGDMTKTEVREYAEKVGLPSATKPDSQGLCFIGHVDMKTFLKNFMDTREGNVLNEAGEVIGTHDGAELVTLGQRGGFTITDKDAHGTVYYVVAKSIADNTIIVSPNALSTTATNLFQLTETNWTQPVEVRKEYTCEIRYHGEPIACQFTDDTFTELKLTENVTMADGQSLVVYDGDVCVGGGVKSM